MLGLKTAATANAVRQIQLQVDITEYMRDTDLPIADRQLLFRAREAETGQRLIITRRTRLQTHERIRHALVAFASSSRVMSVDVRRINLSFPKLTRTFPRRSRCTSTGIFCP